MQLRNKSKRNAQKPPWDDLVPKKGRRRVTFAENPLPEASQPPQPPSLPSRTSATRTVASRPRSTSNPRKRKAPPKRKPSNASTRPKARPKAPTRPKASTHQQASDPTTEPEEEENNEEHEEENIEGNTGETEGQSALPSLPRLLEQSSQTSHIVLSSDPMSTPRQAQSQPFSATEMQHDPQHVMFQIELLINGKNQGTTPLNIDINDFSQLNFGEIKQQILPEVKQWASRRTLPMSDLLSDPWMVTVGALKGNHQVIKVDSEPQWQSVLSVLRVRKKLKDKACLVARIEAYWRTEDWVEEVASVKKTNKSQPKSVRTTVYAEPAPSSDQDQEAFSSEDDMAPELKGRDSTTRRQLIAKRKADLNASLIDALAQKIFTLHTCRDKRCANYGGCCYVQRSNNKHNKIPQIEQEAWAKMIIAKVDDVTPAVPPGNWVAEWIAGYNEVELKRSGKKASAAADPAAPMPASAPLNWFNNPLQQQWPYSSYPLQFPYQQAPSIYPHLAQSPLPPLPAQQSLPAQQAPPTLTPSSPLRSEGSDDDTLLYDYGNWLADREKNPQRRQAIKEAINKASSEFIKFEHLRSIDTLEGVPYGIMIDLKGNLKAFKEHKKAQVQEKTRELEAQIGLVALAQAGR
jgi:hypothetical protein